ncbi:uncharacterized protein LOC143151773 isoform X1 [Ptiloglossa arizonensis]|uniref:uncharacterized protein LOC143151773 isoform X1 n=1 Tax=Ptiloglossa arizonensis TaxID=3350558 RepID=UPI003F9F89F3
MSEFQNLKVAIKSLNKSVSNFPVGAVSIDDFTPIEERIRNMRESLKLLNARLLMLNTYYELQTTNNEPEEDIECTLTNLHEETAMSLITNRAIKLCFHSETTEAILRGKEGDHNMQKKIYTTACQLFSLNDDTLLLQRTMQDALQKQLDLKIQCQNALFDYKKFLQVQEALHNQKLKELNPSIASKKKHTKKLLLKINIMKKLIVNLIAASNQMLLTKPILIKLLENHRDLISMDMILKMLQNNTENANKSTETST